MVDSEAWESEVPVQRLCFSGLKFFVILTIDLSSSSYR